MSWRGGRFLQPAPSRPHSHATARISGWSQIVRLEHHRIDAGSAFPAGEADGVDPRLGNAPLGNFGTTGRRAIGPAREP